MVFHPGSGSPRKNWPADRWRELIPRLPAPISLVVGEAEPDAWRTFTHPGVTVLADLSLAKIADYLAASRLFIGHDSGVSHLAAACGVPCVLLFGPTDPAVWAPPAPHVRVLQAGPDLAKLGVKLTIDEFGIGPSSLPDLPRLPVTNIKIPRTFVEKIRDADNSGIVAKTMIGIGHNMNINVIADGVETSDQLNFLKKNGCDQMQGNLLSEPISLQALAQLVQQQGSNTDAGSSSLRN